MSDSGNIVLAKAMLFVLWLLEWVGIIQPMDEEEYDGDEDFEKIRAYNAGDRMTGLLFLMLVIMVAALGVFTTAMVVSAL